MKPVFFILLACCSLWGQGYGQGKTLIKPVGFSAEENPEPITFFFNGLDQGTCPETITHTIEQDCSILFRQVGSKSCFVHLKRSEINMGTSEVFTMDDMKTTIRVPGLMKPLKAIEDPDYSSMAIPRFAKLEFDSVLAHTFKYTVGDRFLKRRGVLETDNVDQDLMEETVYGVFKDQMKAESDDESMFKSTEPDGVYSNDLLIGGVVKFATSTYNMNGSTLNLCIDWRLFSKSRGALVFQDLVDVEVKLDDLYYEPVSFHTAVSKSLRKLLAYYPEFLQTLGSPVTAKLIADQEPVYIDLVMQQGATFKPTLETVVQKTVVTVIRPDGGHGSGFLISEDGYMLTNAHVVDKYTEVNILFESGFKLKAEVIRKSEKRDVALLKIDAAGFLAATISEKDANLGADIIVVGTPASITLGQSISKGILSGYRLEDGQRYIQTDASINPGNSGGPVFNESLAVIGIVVSKIAHEQIEGISFVIPINEALEALSVVPFK